MGIVSCITIFIFSPCGHENRPILEHEKTKLKAIAVIMTSITIFFAFIMYKNNFDIYRFVVLLLLTLAVNLLIGKIKERRISNE